MGEIITISHLKKKTASTPIVCTHCGVKIAKNELYYLEEGSKQHIRSLIARRFCVSCYTKYGEKKLLKGS